MDTRTERISASASLPLVKRPRKSVTCNPFSYLDFFVGKSLRGLCCRAHSSNGFRAKSVRYDGMIVNNSVFCASPMAVEATAAVSTDFGEAKEEVGTCPGSGSDEIGDGSPVPESSGSSVSFSVSEETGKGEQSHCSSSCCSSDVEFRRPRIFLSMDEPGAVEDCEKPCLDDGTKEVCLSSEIEMMKERFAKLLLGEDMSGSGHGVCTALAISNAITNLSATLFGQIWRLEPLAAGMKSMWRREMEWFLSISDHIVELIPSCQKYPDGSKLEVMTCRPRSDLYINLPALRKLDNMLLEILDGFEKTEFWYLDQGNLTPEADGRTSFRRSIQRQEEKWWLPVPQLPLGGLEENSRKHLQHKRDSTNQILKAAMAINSITLADMEVPDSYLEYLPKNGRACLGDLLHRYLTADEFSSECVLDCFDLSSEIRALEIANRVEASIHVWRRRTVVKPANNTPPRSHSKSSWKWENVKDLMVDAEKRESLADRAQTLLLCLKQRIPGLPQTTLDMCKIQYNKDIGKSILESYSRVLESLAFSIVARIDDLLYADDMTRHSDMFSSMSKVRVIAQRSHLCSYSMPASGSPRRAALATLSCSPKQRKSFSVRVDMSPLINSGSRLSHIHRGLAVRKLFTDLLGTDGKENAGGNLAEESKTNSNVVGGVAVSQMQDSLEGEGK